MKLLVLLFGLAVGFGVGVYWGVHHPAEATSLSTEEERRFIQMQIKTTEAVKSKLDQLSNKQKAAPSRSNGFGSSFVSGGSSAASQAEIDSMRNDQEAQLRDLHNRLDKLK